MEIMSLAIAVFAVIIGLVIGYVSISAKMKSSDEIISGSCRVDAFKC